MGGRLFFKTVCPSLTYTIPECFRDEFFMIKRYTNLRLLYFTLLAKEITVCGVSYSTHARMKVIFGAGQSLTANFTFIGSKCRPQRA